MEYSTVRFAKTLTDRKLLADVDLATTRNLTSVGSVQVDFPTALLQLELRSW
jgi:hypothetical protein